MNLLRNGRRAFILLVALAGLAGIALDAQAQGKSQLKKIVTIEGITEYQLDNGARVLLFPDPSASTVTVNMTVLVGSRHEGYGETGMAHLLEHMLFKGCKLYPKYGEVDKALQDHGAGRTANGTTWLDRTNYYESMPATDKNLEFGIRLEADRLINSLIRREDLKSEMPVVRNEFERNENNPSTILSQRMMAAAYEWHNYGKTTMGNLSDIELVPIERLRDFYKKYYQPDNIILGIAGKFDEQKALSLVAKYFGVIPKPKRELDPTYTKEPAQDGERTVTLRRVGKIAVVGALYHIPNGAHTDFAPMQVLGDILTNVPSGRLYKALVEAKKATSVSSDVTATYDPGVIEVVARVADGTKPEEVRDILLDQLENLKKNPVTKDEVDRAKQRLKAERERSLTSSKDIVLELSDWAGAGDWRMLFINRDRVAKVTPEDVNRAAADYLVRNNRTLGMYIPTGKPDRTTIPEGPSVAELVKDYKGGQGLAGGEVFDPTPANLEKRTQRSTLSSGLKVGYLAKKTRGETVVGQLNLHFGNEKSLAGITTASSFLGSMLMRGTKNKSYKDIQDYLDSLEATLSAGSGTGSLTFSFEAKRKTLPAVLDLLREVLREPAFPEKEFDILKRSTKDSLLKAQTEPQALASRTFGRKVHPYSKDDIRYRPTIEESLERLEKTTLEQVAKLYKEQIGGQTGELVIVGDFDTVAATKTMEAAVADWKTATPYQRIGRKAFPMVKGSRESILTPDKKNAVYIAGFTFAMKDTDADYPALDLANYLLGNPNTSRLFIRLRDKGGLSYSVGSQLNTAARDPYTLFMVHASCKPSNIELADQGVIDELTKAVKKGFGEAEVADGIKGYLQDLRVSFAEDGNVAAALQECLEVGRTWAYYADLESKVNDLTFKEVNAAVSKHLAVDRLVIVRAGDFSKKAKEKK